MIPILDVQIATFIIYGIARQFVIGPYFYTCATIFGPKVFGKISGLGLFVAGAVTLLQLAVNYIVLNFYDGDYLNTRVVLVCLCVPFYLYPYFVWRQGNMSTKDTTQDVELE